MEILTKEEFLAKKEFYIEEMRKGKIFVYGTDTIYGIGCDALNGGGVLKIRKIKKRDEKPFSVIAPGKDWIRGKCFVDGNTEKWLAKLPGDYTLILKLRGGGGVNSKVNEGGESLGVRIPKHWFSGVVEEFGRPFVTTSVNISGERPIKEIGEINEEIKRNVDYIIDEGSIDGIGSKIVNLLEGKEEIIERGV